MRMEMVMWTWNIGCKHPQGDNGDNAYVVGRVQANTVSSL